MQTAEGLATDEFAARPDARSEDSRRAGIGFAVFGKRGALGEIVLIEWAKSAFDVRFEPLDDEVTPDVLHHGLPRGCLFSRCPDGDGELRRVFSGPSELVADDKLQRET